MPKKNKKYEEEDEDEDKDSDFDEKDWWKLVYSFFLFLYPSLC